MSHLDPCTAQFETEVRCILVHQNIAQSMSDAFTDLAKVTKSYIPAANAPTRIDVPRIRRNTAWEGQTIPEDGAIALYTRPSTLVASQSFTYTLNRSRPPGSNDSQTSDLSLNSTIAHSSVPMYGVILDYGDVLDKTT
ncbi:hypothetical protein ACFX15_023927 [Malus domestica]